MERLSLYRGLVPAFGVITLVASACFPDWDSLDPSLAPGAGGGGTSAGNGGSGGGSACTPGQTLPCYDGPEGTEGVGVCVGGETTCDEDGSGFGPCVGSVVPTTETCENQQDDDCDGEVNELDAGCSCTPGTLRDCYDGPMGTDGVGICVTGQQLCAPSGDTFTACVGQTVPVHEECTSGDDDDCDGESNEQCPLWGTIYANNGSFEDVPYDVEVLANGDHYLVGVVRGNVDFGGGNLSPAGEGDVFVAKLDTDGNHIWSQRLGAANYEEALDVAIGANGNIYVVGEFDGTLPLGGPALDLTAQGVEDAFVFAMDSTGTVLWSDAIGAIGANTTALAVAVDANGNVAVTGDYSLAPVDFGGGPETPNGSDGFLVKYDNTGARTFGTGFGAGGNDVGRALAFLGTNLVVAGQFASSIDFGGGGVNGSGERDGFVAMLDGSNNQMWIETVGGSAYQTMLNVTTDGTNIYATGEGAGTIVIDGVTSQADGDDVFILAFGPTGSVLWSRHYIGPGDQHCESAGVAVDGNGQLWFTVSHEQSVDYGNGPLTSAGNDDWALVQLDAATGNTLGSVRIGNDLDQDPRGVGIDQNGNVYVIGDCRGTVDFGFGGVAGTNSNDNICLAKFAP